MKQSGLGIASLVLGIIGMLLSCVAFGIFPCVIGLILAIVALTQKNAKHGTAIAGLVCSVIGIGIFLLMLAGFSIFDNDDDAKKTGEAAKVSEVEVIPLDESEENQKANETEGQESGKTDNVFKVGDVVETDELRISFLSAKEYKTDNEFMLPKDGNMYYAFEFEFENISDSDELVSDWDFECYADGYSVSATYFGDEGLSATLSSGKKTHGYVYYEIPKDTKEIDLEYETNYWTENKVIFKIER